MRNSLKIGRIAGIPIRVHWSFGALVVLVLAVTIGSGVATVLTALGWLVLLFASVVFHEFAHSFVARHRGIAVRDIVLLPIGGVSEIPDLARTPADELHIAIAGPLASAGLAVALGVGGLLGGAALWPPSLVTGSIVVRLAWVNLLLAGFNFLPALPMDGGRVLRAFLAERRGELPATMAAVKIAKVFGIGMIVVGVFVDIWLSLIGIFVLLGAQSEGRMARMKAVLGDRHVGELAVRGPFALPDSMTVGDAVEHRPSFPWHSIPVVGQHGYIGMVSPDELASAPTEERLGAIADQTVPMLDPTTLLFPAALDAFRRSRRAELPVGQGGQVWGVLYATDVEAVLQRGMAVAP
jgi:Zn-dependent protease